MKQIAILIIVISMISSCRPSTKGTEMLPAFDLLLVDSVTHYNTASIPEGNPIVMVFFSPDCIHCQKETRDLLHKMDSLQEVKFYFVTIDPFERMYVYDKMFKLYSYKNITLGQDYKVFFPGHYKNVAPPYTVVYDKYKRCRGIFQGETEATKLISFINTL